MSYEVVKRSLEKLKNELARSAEAAYKIQGDAFVAALEGGISQSAQFHRRKVPNSG